MTSTSTDGPNEGQQLHPLSKTWYYYAIRLDSQYNVIQIDIPIKEVETFWEITNQFPDFTKIYQSAIGLFKDPFKAHYDFQPIQDFSVVAPERDTLVFHKILCSVIGGYIDKVTKEYGEFRGIYISLKNERPMYCFWFTPDDNLYSHTDDVKAALIKVLEECGLPEASINDRYRH